MKAIGPDIEIKLCIALILGTAQRRIGVTVAIHNPRLTYPYNRCIHSLLRQHILPVIWNSQRSMRDVEDQIRHASS